MREELTEFEELQRKFMLEVILYMCSNSTLASRYDLVKILEKLGEKEG
jgi:hypothetical protein